MIGIDISKRWFDGYCSEREAGQRFANTPSGWEELGRWIGPQASQVVMEASGPYYLGLACWLYEHEIKVSVVNPLVIRRYGQMKLARTKTDAKDAALLARYAVEQRPPVWQPPSPICQAMRQLMSLRAGLLRQQSIGIGQAEAFGQSGMDPLVEELLQEQAERIQAALARIDDRLIELVRSRYARQWEALVTIPGIGSKTALMLVCLTDGFARFDSPRALASYVGICPRIWESGSSVKARGSICKLGCSQLRQLLYMCSWTAQTCNPACRVLYERLKAKGKPQKVIKIAIAHKLLRQAFAVGKTQQPFNEKLAMAA